MENASAKTYLNLLQNQLDITKVPFSDRGSRILVYQYPNRQQLFIKLAERIMGLEPGLASYRNRPPFIDNLSFIDDEGRELDFSIVTSPEILIFQTSIGEFKMVFQDIRTISVHVPEGTVAGLRFRVLADFWKVYEKGGEIKSIRNLGYQTNDRQVKNQIKPEKGTYWIEIIVEGNIDTAITLFISPSLELAHETLPFSEAYDLVHKRWMAWFDRIPDVVEPYRKMYAYSWWVMANNLISPQGNVAYEAMTPSKTSYIGLWLWDSAMHALAYRHIDPELARNQIRAMLAYQLPDGMIPDAIHDEGYVAEIDHPITAEVTKPPILAWASLKLHEKAPDLDFLEEIYIPLVRWNQWWFSMNDDDVDGLVQYNHPYSSGLDDNPMWDFGMPVESPDLNTYLCVQMGSLAMMAEALGLEQEAKMWRRRAEAIVTRMIDDFWDDEAGIFRTTLHGEPLPVVTPFNLYPLWTGQLPDTIKARLIEHLRNPEEFWGDYVLPTVARDDPKYDPETMWRGPVWANINYFFIEALKQLNEQDLAIELREKTLQMIMNQQGIFEYYNAETGDPPKKAANVFGWTAAVFIDLVLQKTSEEAKQGNKVSDYE